MKLINCLKNPYKVFVHFAGKGHFANMDDEKYVKWMFRGKMGKPLDLNNPRTFNEKLQWLKLYHRKPEYTMMVDKYLVREYIKEKLGEEYLIPLLGVWDSPDEIDFDALPNQFVLKCNHNSGLGMYICKDKSKMDVEQVKEALRKGLAQDYFSFYREWPYKDVKRRIIAEQYMEEESGSDLIDYKFYCFNGKPEFVYVSQGLSDHATARLSYVWLDWTSTPFYRTDYAPFEEVPPKPKTFEKMLEAAQQLSAEIPFARVDFYEINGRMYFGEITFFPGAGFTTFYPEDWDQKFGEQLKLPEEKVITD